MVYISGGKVRDDPPWSIQRLVGLFWGIIAFFMYFFKTLFGLENSSGSGGRRSGGGSNGRGGPGDGPGGGFRRIGRITTIDDCSMPGGG